MNPSEPRVPLQRLSAILMADVVNYSGQMRRDQAGTHERVQSLRDGVVEPIFVRHRGRVVHRAGDGVLVEFPSCTRALAAAIEVQRTLAARNAALPAGDRVMLRIGVSVGDILIDRDEIAGCDVNLAARLQTVAEPGGICLSAALRDLVHEDLGVRFEDGGERPMKNIGCQRFFRVRPAGALAAKDGRVAMFAVASHALRGLVHRVSVGVRAT